MELQGELSANVLLGMIEPIMTPILTGGDAAGLDTGGLGNPFASVTMSVLNLNPTDLWNALGAAMGGVGGLLPLFGETPACAEGKVIDDAPYSFSPCSPFSPAYWAVAENYYPPETSIHEPSIVDARGTLITFDAYDEKDSDGQIRFSYRLDHGFWSPWRTERFAAVKGLLEGYHMFEVRAVDSDGNIEATPARMVFQVDSIPPTISLSGKVRGSAATFVAEVWDYQSKPEAVKLSYRLDSDTWSDYQYSKAIELAHLSDGTHTLSVRAMDAVGNEAIATQAFNVTPEAAFGCSAVPVQGGAAFLLLLIPGLIIIRRRIKR
jgi:hypothetical protein